MCVAPITIKNERTGTYMQVPCGKCIECLLKQQSQWCARMSEEWKYSHRKAVFFTLTYNDNNVPKNYLYNGEIYQSIPQYGIEIKGKNGAHTKDKVLPQSCLPKEAQNLPIVPFKWDIKHKEISRECVDAIEQGYPISFNSVRKEDVQYAIKRFRKNHQNSHFTYYLTSEYGPSTERPHYHGIFFGVSKIEMIDFFNEWKRYYGVQLTAEDVTDEGAFGYVSKYASKGMFENVFCSKDFFYPQGDGTYKEYHSKNYEMSLKYFGVDIAIVQPTFHLVSKGLGIGYLTESKIEYHIGKQTDRLRKRIMKFARNRKYINKNNKEQRLPSYYEIKLYNILKAETGSDYCKHRIQEVLRRGTDEVYIHEYAFMEAEEPYRKGIEVFRAIEKKKTANQELQKISKFNNLNNTYKHSRL